MLDQLNFVWVKSFFNNIIHVDKINFYSKISIVDDTIPELTLLLKLFHLHLFYLWWFEMLLCVHKPLLSLKVRISDSYFILLN